MTVSKRVGVVLVVELLVGLTIVSAIDGVAQGLVGGALAFLVLITPLTMIAFPGLFLRNCEGGSRSHDPDYHRNIREQITFANNLANRRNLEEITQLQREQTWRDRID